MSDDLKKNLLVAFVSVFLTLLCVGIAGEVYVRMTKPYWTLDKTTKFDPSLYARHIFEPQRRHHVRLFPRRETWINSKGFRDTEFSEKKPDGQLRLIVYGGSQVFDTQADTYSDWPNRAERRLEKSLDRDVQVINAGIPGHASHDSLGRLYARGHFYDPDYVVLCNAWNDIKEFHHEKSLLRFSKNFLYSDNVRRTYLNSIDRFLGETSQFYTRLRINLIHYFINVGPEGRSRASSFHDTIQQKQLKQYRLTMKSFVDVSRSIDAVPILMTQPRLVSENNTPSEKKKIRYRSVGYRHEKLLEAFRSTDDIIEGVSNVKDASLFNANEILGSKTSLYSDQIHLTQEGSGRLADKMEQFVVSLERSRSE